MKAYAHAKINWALDVLGRRKDGYHMLDMLMQPLTLCDDLELDDADEISLSIDGRLAEDASDNLVVRAARALNRYTGRAHGAHIRLVKRIPERAGLGGGSADCAAALRALNQLWRLGLNDEALAHIGISLGADVPYCLRGELCRVRGIGEQLCSVSGARVHHFVLVRVGNGLSTAEVFAHWDELSCGPTGVRLSRIERAVTCGSVAELRNDALNALERPATLLMPEILNVKREMYRLGAQLALMSGSGSTVAGIFPDRASAQNACSCLKNAILTETLT